MEKPRIEFAPGCFDSFEGTQEELDALIAEIRRAVESGEIFENSEELSEDVFESEYGSFDEIFTSQSPRNLH